jgi:hypothetical protein
LNNPSKNPITRDGLACLPVALSILDVCLRGAKYTDVSWSLLRKAFIWALKMSQTAGTLCEMLL